MSSWLLQFVTIFALQCVPFPLNKNMWTLFTLFRHIRFVNIINAVSWKTSLHFCCLLIGDRRQYYCIFKIRHFVSYLSVRMLRYSPVHASFCQCYYQSPIFDDMSSFFPCEIDDAIQYINLGYGAQDRKIIISLCMFSLFCVVFKF